MMDLIFYLLGSFPPEVVAAVRSQGGLLPSSQESLIKPGVWPISFRYFIGFDIFYRIYYVLKLNCFSQGIYCFNIHFLAFLVRQESFIISRVRCICCIAMKLSPNCPCKLFIYEILDKFIN